MAKQETDKIPEHYLDTQAILPKGWVKPDGSRYSLEELKKKKDELFFEFYDFVYDTLLKKCIAIENQKEIAKLLQDCSPSMAEIIEQSKPFVNPIEVAKEWERTALMEERNSLYKVAVIGLGNEEVFKNRFKEFYCKGGRYIDKEQKIEFFYLSTHKCIDGVRFDEVVNMDESKVDPKWYKKVVARRMKKERKMRKKIKIELETETVTVPDLPKVPVVAVEGQAEELGVK